MKRYLDCSYSELENMSKYEVLESIRASEGRVVVAENSLCNSMLIRSISNAEIVAAFGADIILLNMLDVYHPKVDGIVTEKEEDVIRELKRLTGCLIGINLEPVDLTQDIIGERRVICEGRQASAKTALQAKALGVDFILLTGNPGSGVNNNTIVKTLKEMNAVVGDEIVLMAGKMHAAGSKKETGEHIITKATIQKFAEAGADIILLPAPGTVPGITLEFVKELVSYAHELDAMTITAIGTSQEGADDATIRQIALLSKMSGTDLHHIGDSCFTPVVSEGLLTYSIAIRGKRHTYARMARSINR